MINRLNMEDLTARHAELTDEREDLQSTLDDARETLADGTDDTSALSHEEREDLQTAVADAREALLDWDTSGEALELADLNELLDELRGAGGDHKYNGDWYPGELIDVDSFTEYAEELATECYDIPDTWPHRCIDWQQAARELAQDYSLITFNGTDYYYRSA